MASPFPDAALTRDAFLGGALHLWQPVAGYRAGIDPVLLAASIPARPGEAVLELGCGAGAAILCLGRRVAGLRLAGLELQDAYAALARRNAAANGLPLEVHDGDVAAPPAALRALSFDHVIINPPYFDRSLGTASRDAGRDVALAGATPMPVWIDAATRRLKPGGRLTLIARIARLPDILGALDERLGGAMLRPLAPRPGREADLFLLRATKGNRAAFRLLPPLPLHDGATHREDSPDFTPEIAAVLRAGAALAAFP